MSVAFAVHAIGVLAIAYFAAVNTINLAFTVVAWRALTTHLRRESYAGADEAFASPLTPAVSILLPAFNEEAVVVESVNALLRLRYPELEVVVVNDGSTDGTLDRLREAFDLVEVRRVSRGRIPSAPVRATYVARGNPGLVVIDKVNGGGKADAMNAGLDAARHPYVCAMDADTLLEEDALLRVARPLLDDPELVAATGGTVRIVNGCTVEGGRVTRVGLPPSRLATLQVIEYFRAFLIGRVAWDRLNALLIISGAFGLFRRSAVEACGGWSTTTVGEDLELVLRLHRYFHERGEEYRVGFVADPVCWTEAPETLGALATQRRRWHRGLAESLWRHRRMMLNPRFGALGLVALPYFVVFELLGPLVALAGYLVLPVAFAAGLVSWPLMAAFVGVSILFGQLLSVSALALEERAFQRHPSHGEIVRLLVFAALENFGYRQLNDVWRVLAFVDLARRRSEWGQMPRRGFTTAAPAADPAAP